MAQGVVDGDSGAEQRRRFGREQIIRHQSHCFGRDHHILGIATVKADGGDLFELTQNEVAAAARVALEAVSAMPTNSHALAGLPQGDVSANGIDAPGNLVARHSRVLNSRPQPFFHERVAVTDAAGFHLDAHLPASGLRSWALDDFETTSRLADLDGLHANPFLCDVNILVSCYENFLAGGIEHFV